MTTTFFILSLMLAALLSRRWLRNRAYHHPEQLNLRLIDWLVSWLMIVVLVWICVTLTQRSFVPALTIEQMTNLLRSVAQTPHHDVQPQLLRSQRRLRTFPDTSQ